MIRKTSSSRPNSRTLILHVGMPKTGTTMIQEFINKNSSVFIENGVGVEAVEGGGAHYLLGQYLLGLDDRATQSCGYFLGALNQTNYFPNWTNEKTYLISSEDMHKIGSHGVDAVISYANSFNATIKVVCTLRNPLDWLWSSWTQITKLSYVDWIEFINQSIKDKSGFLSSVLLPWTSESVKSILIVKYDNIGLLNNFINRLNFGEFSFSDIGNGDGTFMNIGGNIIYSMYRATMVKDVVAAISSHDRFQFETPDPGFVERMLLDIGDSASPVFEISQKYEDMIIGMMNESDSPIGTDSYQLLSKYLEEWAKDARKVAKSAASKLDKESRSIIEHLAKQADEEYTNLLETPDICRKYPQINFTQKLPIDAQFIGLSRTLATAILLSHRIYRTFGSRTEQTSAGNVINL